MDIFTDKLYRKYIDERLYFMLKSENKTVSILEF